MATWETEDRCALEDMVAKYGMSSVVMELSKFVEFMAEVSSEPAMCLGAAAVLKRAAETPDVKFSVMVG